MTPTNFDWYAAVLADDTYRDRGDPHSTLYGGLAEVLVAALAVPPATATRLLNEKAEQSPPARELVADFGDFASSYMTPDLWHRFDPGPGGSRFVHLLEAAVAIAHPEDPRPTGPIDRGYYALSVVFTFGVGLALREADPERAAELLRGWTGFRKPVLAAAG